ncbi:MAG: hypothetical protein RXR51_03735 [Nitrososphaeria archaeon]|jgi:hypothetical protein
MLKIGSEAPDFELKNQDRKAVRLSQYMGKSCGSLQKPESFAVYGGDVND